MKRSVYHDRVSIATQRTRRRRRVAAMRADGVSVRAIAAELGVSHPTVLRDLRALDEAEAEQILAVLAGQQRPQARARRRRARYRPFNEVRDDGRLTASQRKAARQSKSWRRHYAAQLRVQGLSLRAIAREVGSSPATVLRDLRRQHT